MARASVRATTPALKLAPITEDDMSERTAYTLASLADCASPDSQDSAGATFLVGIEDSIDELRENGELDEDSTHEVADGAVPIYTHELWRVFVDLAAYNEDPTDLGCDGSDMEQAAKVCLYLIAERLAAALIADGASSDDE